MKKNKLFLALALVAALMLASCQKVNDSAKLIPNDASVVVRIDPKQLIEKSGVADNSQLMKQLKKEIKDADMSRSMAKRLNAILDDPRESGLDLSEPVFCYVQISSSRERFGLVASVGNEGKLKDIVNAIQKESDDEKVKEYEGLNVVSDDEVVLAFDGKFLTFVVDEDAEEDELLDEVADMFHGDGKGSMLDSEPMERLCASKGVAQVLVNGSGLSSIPDLRELESLMPSGLDLEEVSVLMDLAIEKGKATLSAELLPLSKEWEDYIKEGDRLLNDFDADLIALTSGKGLSAFLNVDVKRIYDLLDDNGLLNDFSSDDLEQLNELMESLTGAAAFDLYDMDKHLNNPIFAAYVGTKDDGLLDITNQLLKGEDVKELGDDEYQMVADYSINWDDYSRTPKLWLNFGKKKGYTYFYTTDDADAKPKTRGTLSKSDVKGKGLYVRFNFAFISSLASRLDDDEGIQKELGKLARTFDYADYYYEGSGKYAIGLYTKDKSKNPLAEAISLAVSMTEAATARQSRYVEDYSYYPNDDSIAEAEEDYYEDSIAVAE